MKEKLDKTILLTIKDRFVFIATKASAAFCNTKRYNNKDSY